MKWFVEGLDTVKQKFNTTDGLTSEEVVSSRDKYGENKLTEKKKKSSLMMFLDQFKDAMIIVLFVAAIISYFLGDKIEAIIIIAIVVLNALIGFIQENKAEASLEALKEMSSPYSKVIRNGQEVSIPSQEVVVGDLLLLEAGDLVSADIRLIESNSLKVQEASLTGESLPVDKHYDYVGSEEDALGDRKNMVYSSGMVTYGRGKGIVVGVGMDTEVGKIAQMLQETETESTPLQKSLDNLGKKLGLFALAAVIVIFAISFFKTKMDLMDNFMTSVSLAVAVIPEGLPAISTIVLAMGVKRLVEKNAIVRNLPSVETLGSASVICSDKTGTLTQNKMTVVDSYTYGEENDLALYASLCNDSRFIEGSWVGDPTETALTAWSDKLGIETTEMIKTYARVNEVPFDSGRKRMTTVHEIDGKLVSITKGGVDEVLNATTHLLKDGEVVLMSDQEKEVILRENEKMAKQALRVLALGIRELTEQFDEGDLALESDLTFVGLIGMIDPAREEVYAAIETCKHAGIRPVMITGDHAITAEAIAKDIGLLEAGQRVVTGNDLDKMSDEDLFNNVKEIGVYARVSPEDKMRIIHAWKSHGEIVAMTGDGVNDAPALKRADIGCAMGVVGTEVAKGAADMVLTDDNFATVVVAVEEGRRIKDNIMKAINYLLSCNVGELLTLLVAVLFNWGVPLIPIHILWVNLVTDSLPALALGVDPAEEDIMDREPDTSDSLISKKAIWRILYQGVMIGGITLFAYMYGSGRLWNPEGSVEMGQTMAFTVLAFSQLIHAFNIHSPRKSIFSTFFKNKWLLLATFANALMMFAVLFIPPVREIFSLVAMDAHHWEVAVLLILAPLPIVEFMKLIKIH